MQGRECPASIGMKVFSFTRSGVCPVKDFFSEQLFPRTGQETAKREQTEFQRAESMPRLGM